MARIPPDSTRTKLPAPRRLFRVPAFVSPHDGVTSATESFVDHFVSHFMVGRLADFPVGDLFFGEFNHGRWVSGPVK
jgi:hypothetical protein